MTTKHQGGQAKKVSYQHDLISLPATTPVWVVSADSKALDFRGSGETSQSPSRSLGGSRGKLRRGKRLARGFMELAILIGARQLSSAAKTRGLKIVLNLHFLNVFIIVLDLKMWNPSWPS